MKSELFKKITRLLPKTAAWRNAGMSRKVRSAGAFHRILVRERIRADRSSRAFSLLVFDTGKMAKSEAVASPLMLAIARRVRAIDEIGWFGDNGLGVVLPDTPETGARKLAAELLESMAAAMKPVPVRIYAYPSSWLPGALGQLQEENVRHSMLIHENGTRAQAHSSSTRSTNGLPFAGACARETSNGNGRAQGIAKAGVLPRPHLPRWKRGLDIAGALSCLLLLSPFMILIALYIKLVSPGPVFFRQTRIGQFGRPFEIVKFRTMRANADAATHREHMQSVMQTDQPMTKLDVSNDARIIPLGGILRSSGLDELPQLINVLRGEMSLVGPRPCLLYEAQSFLRWQAQRFDAVPGITGLWQVSGKNRLTFKEMIRLDIKYARASSLPMDMKILLKTFPAILDQISDAGAQKSAEA